MSNVIYKNKRYINYDALENIVAYALRTHKNELNNPKQRVPWGGNGVITQSPQTAINSFKAVKNINSKADGNLLHHVIITFKTSRKDVPILIRDAYYLGGKVGFEVFKNGFQNIYFIHRESNSIHIHMVINSINYCDGNRLINNKWMCDKIINKLYELCPHLEWDKNIIYKK